MKKHHSMPPYPELASLPDSEWPIILRCARARAIRDWRMLLVAYLGLGSYLILLVLPAWRLEPESYFTVTYLLWGIRGAFAVGLIAILFWLYRRLARAAVQQQVEQRRKNSK